MSSKKRAKSERKFTSDMTSSFDIKNPGGDPVIKDVANSVIMCIFAPLAFAFVATNNLATPTMYALLMATFFGILFPIGVFNRYHYQKTWLGFPVYSKYLKGEDGIIPNVIRYSGIHTLTFIAMLIAANFYLAPLYAFICTCFHVFATTENAKEQNEKSSSVVYSILGRAILLFGVTFSNSIAPGPFDIIPLLSILPLIVLVMNNHLPRVILLIEWVKHFTSVFYTLPPTFTTVSSAYYIVLIFAVLIHEIGNIYLKSDQPRKQETPYSIFLLVLVVAYPIVSTMQQFSGPYLQALHILMYLLTLTTAIDLSNFDTNKGAKLLGGTALSVVMNAFSKQ
jgi:hypothetical protein